MKLESYDFAQRSSDLKKIARLEAAPLPPTDHNKTQLCALFMRYGDEDKLVRRMADLMHEWDYSPTTLMCECREIWLSGYRPTNTDYGVGSANDTQEDS